MNMKKITVIGFIVPVVLFVTVILEKSTCAADDELTKDNFFKTEFVHESKVLVNRNIMTIDRINTVRAALSGSPEEHSKGQI